MAGIVNPGDEIKAEQINEVFELANTANESALDSAGKILYMQQDLNALNSAIINAEFIEVEGHWVLRVTNKTGAPMDVDMDALIDSIIAAAKA